ncbi:MAG: cytochrome c biosis protein [Actinomycetia bacterium]|nr:cytochrome c biosis protein [Actinomycetes bacterium]
MPLLALFSRFEHVSPGTYFFAFAGGFVSFLSPCVLPLVPGYVSMVTGLDIATLQEGPRTHVTRIMATTALFIAGFGVVFVLLGLSASTLGSTLIENKTILTRLSGALMLAMALFLLGSMFLRAPWLYQEKRFHPQLGRFGTAAPLVAGVAFGFGWSPCIGPILGSILGIAARQDRVWAGGTLLAVYTLGLGVPFLVVGLTLGRVGGALSWVKRHFGAILVGSSVVLAIFGLLLVFDQLTRVTTELQRALDRSGLDWLVNLG